LEQLEAIPEEYGEEEDVVNNAYPAPRYDCLNALKPRPRSPRLTSGQDIFSFDAQSSHQRLQDTIHGSPGSQRSRIASSCTQVEEEDVADDEDSHSQLRRGPSFTESEIEEWYAEQPKSGPRSMIQSLSQGLNSCFCNQDAHAVFLDMEKSLEDLGRRHLGSSRLVEEAKWRLASIMRELYGESAVVDTE
jgi:hypothetical protein